jgi:hypothetical protein
MLLVNFICLSPYCEPTPAFAAAVSVRESIRIVDALPHLHQRVDHV